MCAAYELNSRMIRPGKWAAFWRKIGSDQLIWAGFARAEILQWWLHKGGELVDVPAHRFAERSDRSGQLGWDSVPTGKVLRGMIDPNDGKPLLKIVTRPSSQDEMLRFEHSRMPLIEDPLFSSQPIEVKDEGSSAAQMELF